ncbi:MAG: hypothetical protein GXC73_10495 [Chitinophagaceae bacterium]|nr:hypothetical protein [Chitinophagaceae bacterium]
MRQAKGNFFSCAKAKEPLANRSWFQQAAHYFLLTDFYAGAWDLIVYFQGGLLYKYQVV